MAKEQEVKSSLHKITKGSFLLFFGKMFDSTFMFLFNVVAARMFLPEEYSSYVYLITFVLFFAIVIKLGLDQGISALAPKYSKNQKTVNNLISFSIFFLLSIAVLVVVFVITFPRFTATYFLNDSFYQEKVLRFIPLVILLPLTSLSEGIFRTIGEIKHYTIAKNIIIPILMVLSIFIQIFVLDYKDELALLYSNYIGWTSACIYIIFVLWRKRYLVFPSVHYTTLYKKLILLSLPLIFVGILDYLLGRMDVYMIGYLLDDVKVGIYNIAEKVAYLSSFLFVAVSSIFAPEISKSYYEKKYNELEKSYQQLTRWILIINTCVFFIILLNSKDLLLIFGEAYLLGSTSLIILGLAQWINASAGPVIYMNSMTGKGNTEFMISILLLVLNCLCNIIFIKKIGFIGVAYATTIVFLIGNIVRLKILYTNLKVHPFSKKYLNVVISGIAAYIPTLWIKQSVTFDHFFLRLLFISFFYCIMYSIISFAFSLEQSERKWLKEKVRRGNS